MEIVLSREQVRRVDQQAVTRYGIPSLILMENAGRNAAEIVHRTYGTRGRAPVICGPGNNGGDGCVIARHLHNFGWEVRLLMTGQVDDLTPDARVNYQIVLAMGLNPYLTTDAAEQRHWIESIRADDIIVDALLGTGFHGQVRDPLARLIAAINASPRRTVVAVDVPSGLDCDTGQPSNATICADLTVTFVATKRGFLHPEAAPYVGRVEVADIGAPRELVADVGAGR